MVKIRAGVGRALARDKSIDLGPVLDEIADDIEAFAVGLAAGHVDSGDYVDSLKQRVDRSSPSGRDRLVYSDDPAAVAIEFGHLSGKTESEGRRPVAGQHILSRAAYGVPSV